MKAPLRSHPTLRFRGLSSWPPAWGGAYDRAARLPLGEEGTLEDVGMIQNVAGLECPALQLQIRLDGRPYSGLLLVDDTALLPTLERLLRQQLGRPVTEIGALVVDLPIQASALTRVDSDLLGQDEILAEIVRRLVDAYRPRAIYLFGSRARGDYAAGSDYDLLVVVGDDAPAERRSSAKAYECLRGMDEAVDVLVCTDNYFRTGWRVITALPTTVARLNKLVYCAYAP